MLQKDEIYFCLETYFLSLNFSLWHENTFILSAAKAVKAKLHVIFIEHKVWDISVARTLDTIPSAL